MARGEAPSRGQLGDLPGGVGSSPPNDPADPGPLAGPILLQTLCTPPTAPPRLDRPILPPLQTSFLGSTRTHRGPLSLPHCQESRGPPSPPRAPPARPAHQGDFAPPPGSGTLCSCGPCASGEAQIMRGASCPFRGPLPPPYPMPKPTSMVRRCPSRLCSEPARPGPPQWKCSCSAR